LLMIVADEDDGRLPVEARASLALLAAQLNAGTHSRANAFGEDMATA
jgi:hypothetical protein